MLAQRVRKPALLKAVVLSVPAAVWGKSRSLLVMFLLVAGCAGEEEVTLDLSAVPTAHVEYVGEVVVDRVAVASAGSREDQGYALHLVQDGELSSRETILVATEGAQSVYRIDGTGQLVETIGGPGEGPGEFSRVRSIANGFDGLPAFWDLASRRLTWWEGDEAHVLQTTEIDQEIGQIATGSRPVDVLEVSDSSLGIVYTQPAGRSSGFNQERVFIALVDREGHSIGLIGPIPGNQYYSEKGASLLATFGPRNHLGSSGGFIYSSDGTSSMVLKHGLDGQIHQVLDLGIEARPLSEQDRDEVVDRFLTTRISAADRPFTEPLVRSGFAADHFPVFTDMRAGDGWLWLAGYAGKDENREWFVVDLDDHRFWRTSIPATWELLDVDAEHVLVLETADSGAEVVSVYGWSVSR